MERGDIGFVAGLAGFLLGGWAVFTSLSMKSDVESVMNERKADEDALAGLGARVEDLDRSQKDLTRRVNSFDASPRSIDGRIQALEERLAALEAGREPAKTSEEQKNLTPGDPDAAKKKFDELRAKVYAGESTNDEEEEFWRLSREQPELLKGILTDLEKKVADAPRDIDARLALASAYIAKLFTVPSGPEQGVWSMKAVAQWNKVLEQEPNNWDAHQSLGFNYSFWPEQFNKGPDAIKHFEAARKIQESATPEAQHANTYVQLQKLYVKVGKPEEAAKVLEEGLRRFPDDEDLKKLK